jgi:Txe/YoeB family toxin of Txe-Axe toxin-antitoxin module
MYLVAEKGFKKAFKRLIKKNPNLQQKIMKVLDMLEADPFSPSLKSHKLTGNLANCWSCSGEHLSFVSCFVCPHPPTPSPALGERELKSLSPFGRGI